jgi:hypothetical protein
MAGRSGSTLMQGGTIFRHVVHPLFVQTIVNPNINKVPSDKACHRQRSRERTAEDSQLSQFSDR